MQKAKIERPIRRWGIRGAWAVAALLLLAMLFVLVLRQQWKHHTHEVEAWFEQHVGPLDMASYLRAPVADQENLAVVVSAIASDPLLNTADSVSARETGRKLFGIEEIQEPEEGAFDISAAELAQLRSTVSGASALLSRIDALGGLTETRRDRPLQNDTVGDELALLHLAGFRQAQMALNVHDGECFAAGEASTGIERIAATLSAEPQMLSTIVGLAIEKMYFGSLLRLAEAEIAGRCRTEVFWPEVRAALGHLQAVKAPLARTIAAEGAQLRHWMAEYQRGAAAEHGQRTLMERALGPNAMGFLSSGVSSYGSWAVEVGQAHGTLTDVPQPPLVALPARWLFQDFVAQFMPNLKDTGTKYETAMTAERLVVFAIERALCARARDCLAREIALPVSFPSGQQPRILNTAEGATVTFLPLDADRWQVSGARGSLCFDLPEASAP